MIPHGKALFGLFLAMVASTFFLPELRASDFSERMARAGYGPATSGSYEKPGSSAFSGLGAGYGVVGASLARAEEAICRSMVNYSHVRGAFGEAVMDRVALGARRGGGWQSVGVSRNPRGIDGIYIRRDPSGNPRGLLVGEAKFGSARLGMTRDGRQMSSAWTSPRLAREASRFRQAGGYASVEMRARPRGPGPRPDIVKVRLSDGRDGFFWRTGQADPWFYDGPRKTLDAAKRAAIRDGRYLQAAADGGIGYRRRVFRVDVFRDTISVKIQDADSAVSSGTVSLKEIARVEIDASGRMRYMAEIKEEIAHRLMAKAPRLSQEEAKAIAGDATRRMRHLEDVLGQENRARRLSILADSGRVAVAGGTLAGALDAIAQISAKGRVDWRQAGEMALIGAGSAGAGALARHWVAGGAIDNVAIHRFFAQTANALGLPTGMAAANLAGQGFGGIAGSLVYGTLMYGFGRMEGDEAIRMAVSGAAGSVAGMAAGAGLVAFAGMYGTAGTGAAISSLSGAAAQSASLAWLGGGSLAAGGGGMALGTMVVSGGAAAAVLATTSIISRGYAMYDDHAENQRHQYNASKLLRNDGAMRELCARQWFPGSGVVQ